MRRSLTAQADQDVGTSREVAGTVTSTRCSAKSIRTRLGASTCSSVGISGHELLPKIVTCRRPRLSSVPQPAESLSGRRCTPCLPVRPQGSNFAPRRSTRPLRNRQLLRRPRGRMRWLLRDICGIGFPRSSPFCRACYPARWCPPEQDCDVGTSYMITSLCPKHAPRHHMCPQRLATVASRTPAAWKPAVEGTAEVHQRILGLQGTPKPARSGTRRPCNMLWPQAAKYMTRRSVTMPGEASREGS